LAEIIAEAPPRATSSSPLSDHEEGGPTVEEAAELVESLARAVQVVHELGLVHGGLNPYHVRLTPAGVPKITGFRRARLSENDGEEAGTESANARLAGYLAPEQLEGSRQVLRQATDVYALGALLYALLTGQPPFRGSTLRETMEQVRSREPAAPRRGQPAIPSELEALCLQCLEKQPSRRPVSAQALADALRRFVPTGIEE
jgi:serine/threonine-protein kinase